MKYGVVLPCQYFAALLMRGGSADATGWCWRFRDLRSAAGRFVAEHPGPRRRWLYRWCYRKRRRRRRRRRWRWRRWRRGYRLLHRRCRGRFLRSRCYRWDSRRWIDRRWGRRRRRRVRDRLVQGARTSGSRVARLAPRRSYPHQGPVEVKGSSRFARTSGDLHHRGSSDRLYHRRDRMLAVRQLLVAGTGGGGHPRIA